MFLHVFSEEDIAFLINLLNPTDSIWPNDIGFDKKSTQEIKIYIMKYGQGKKQLKDVLLNNYNDNRKKENIMEE